MIPGSSAFGPSLRQDPPSTLIKPLLHCHAVCRQTFTTVPLWVFPCPPSTLSFQLFCLGGVCSMLDLLRFQFGVLVPSALLSCSMSAAISCAGLTPSLTSSRSFAMVEHFLHLVDENPGFVTKATCVEAFANAHPHADVHWNMGMLQSAFSTRCSGLLPPLSVDLTHSEFALGLTSGQGASSTCARCLAGVLSPASCVSFCTIGRCVSGALRPLFAGVDSSASSAYTNTTDDFHLPK